MMMNVFALTAEGADNAINWGERASTAGVTTLLGMVAIFTVLALLWGCIELMHLLLHRGEKAKKAEKPKASASAPAAAPAADDAAIAAAIAASLAAAEDDGAVIAAITAAISAMRTEDGCDTGFRVVSFKRAARGGARKRF